MSEQVKDYPPYLDYPKPRKKQTNADRVRSMSLEELAYMIGHRDCPEGHFWGDSKCRSCVKCWLAWLKEEVPE